MEHLICNLKDKLFERRRKEVEKVLNYNKEKDKELILLSSGKIYELDEILGYLDDMLNYNNQTKKIIK